MNRNYAREFILIIAKIPRMEKDKKSNNPLINHYNLINVFTYDKYFFSAFLTTPTAFYAVMSRYEQTLFS